MDFGRGKGSRFGFWCLGYILLYPRMAPWRKRAYPPPALTAYRLGCHAGGPRRRLPRCARNDMSGRLHPHGRSGRAFAGMVCTAHPTRLLSAFIGGSEVISDKWEVRSQNLAGPDYQRSSAVPFLRSLGDLCGESSLGVSRWSGWDNGLTKPGRKARGCRAWPTLYPGPVTPMLSPGRQRPTQ